MSIAAALTEAVGRVAPVSGVSIGRMDDRATWGLDFSADATDAQRNAAAAVLASFDPVAVEARVAMMRLTAEADKRIATRPVHAEKFAQAMAVQSNPELPLSDVPLIEASIGFDGATAADVAAVVIRKYTAAVTYAAAVERARMVAEQAIKNASTVRGVEEAARSVAWPTP